MKGKKFWKNDRFIDIGLVKQFKKTQQTVFNLPLYCFICGDTNPEYGFYPLGFPEGLKCNRCARSDEDYLKMFKEEKEEIIR